MPIRIYGESALIDNDIPRFNRLFQLVDTENYDELDWIEVPKRTEGFIGYFVVGESTWYDAKSTVIFDFLYDGIKYRGYLSSYYGFEYEKRK